MNHLSSGTLQEARNGAVGRPAIPEGDPGRTAVPIPLLALRAGESARLEGQDKAHVARLAEADTPLPPILVDRRDMRVIDGMHRLLAASLRGQETIDVEFFDGSPEDAFLHAVRVNTTHGLPLSLEDRRAAAARIVASRPQMSDRAIGQAAGLAARTVAKIRRSAGGTSGPAARIGQDGKVRPLSSAEGRRRAARLLAAHPGASLRAVAREAGISPATVGDVRRRLERGQGPVLAARSGLEKASGGKAAKSAAGFRPGTMPEPAPSVTVEKLRQDPSLRNNELGRWLLRALQLNTVGTEQLSIVAAAVPPHCVPQVMYVARHHAQMWHRLAQELGDRLRIAAPFTAVQ